MKNNLSKLLDYLEKNNIAYDIGSYRDAPLGIRIWGGATINHKDIDILLDWLEWGYYEFIAKRIIMKKVLIADKLSSEAEKIF